eukprot:TRINITY_DN12296_c0_g1_i1.p1 TRINITY_DN12296_c0_g1~~TRINITY_DN12296_c0_g1_i1.p1  ORF type:complete len:725 (-),score=149.56 TRINITY_DN12296_c0_g1_i1:4-2178(-)
MEEMRKRKIWELFDTEKRYLDAISLALTEYAPTLKELVSEQKYQSLFSNLDQIFEINNHLYSRLKAVLGDSYENMPEDISVSVILIDFVDQTELYGEYAAGHSESIKTMLALENNKEANKFLEDTPLDKEILDLSSLLIQPIQRIPRYRLLLEDIIKNTDPSHPDFRSTQEALDKIKEVALTVNEEVRKFENIQKIAEIRKMFGRIKEVRNLVEDGRFFIHEGSLWKVCRKKDKKFYFALFNDMLIYGTPTLKDEDGKIKAVDFNRIIDLKMAKVDPIPDTDELKYAFYLYAAPKSFTIYADSQADKTVWMSRFKEILEEHEDSITAPVWIQDSQSTKCMHCERSFTVTFRRHHCRNCGDLVCAKCSPHSAIVYHVNPSKPKRICTKNCSYLLNYDKVITFSGCLLGSSFSGKKRLLSRLVFNSFETDDEIIQFLIQRGQVMMTHKQNELSINFKFKINIGDITPDVLSGADIFFLIFDITDYDSFSQMENYYTIVKNKGKNIVIVGTKADEEFNRGVSSEEAQNYATSHGCEYAEVSAKDGDNVLPTFIDNVIEAITKKFKDSQEHIYFGDSKDWSVKYQEKEDEEKKSKLKVKKNRRVRKRNEDILPFCEKLNSGMNTTSLNSKFYLSLQSEMLKNNVREEIGDSFLSYIEEYQVTEEELSSLSDNKLKHYIWEITDTHPIEVNRILKSIRSLLSEQMDNTALLQKINSLKEKIERLQMRYS